MTSLAPTVQAFFTDRLIRQRQASPHTVAAYRDAFRLLFSYVADATGRSPAKLDWADIDAVSIGAFLHHLEAVRGNSVRSRNARLSAIHSFFEFAALRHPEQADLIQRVLAIPEKRFDTAVVCYLTLAEVDALLANPDRSTWVGQRDHALMLLAVQTGLRVSELAALHGEHVELGSGAHVRCWGKGRKERCTPLTKETVEVLRLWIRRRDGRPEEPLFPSRGSDRQLTRSAIWRLITKHASAASQDCPSLAHKGLTPHTLRHTAAMRLLESGADVATIALWLGHSSLQSTNIYLHADMALKERALARTTPVGIVPGATTRPTSSSPSWNGCDYVVQSSLFSPINGVVRATTRHNSERDISGEDSHAQLAVEHRLADQDACERRRRIHCGVGQKAKLFELGGLQEVGFVDEEHDAAVAL